MMKEIYVKKLVTLFFILLLIGTNIPPLTQAIEPNNVLVESDETMVYEQKKQQMKQPDFSDLSLLAMHYNESITIGSNGVATVAIEIDIPDSPLAQSYRNMLGVTDETEQIDIPKDMKAIEKEDDIIVSSGREALYTLISNECWFYEGIHTDIIDSSVLPQGADNECSIFLEADGYLDVQDIHDGVWTTGYGLSTTYTINDTLNFIFSDIGMKRLSLESYDGSNYLRQTRSTMIRLPRQATLLNGYELKDRTWTIDLGDRSSLQAEVHIIDTRTLSLKEELIITEDLNISQINPQRLQDYKSFLIKYYLRNSPTLYEHHDKRPMALGYRGKIWEISDLSLCSFDLSISGSKGPLLYVGTVEFSLTVDAKIGTDIGWVRAHLSSHLLLSVEGGAAYDSEWQDLFWESPKRWSFAVGPIPVILEAGPIQYRVEAKVATGLKVETEAYCNATVKMGAKFHCSIWDGCGWDKIWDYDFETYYKPPTLTITDARAEFKLSVSFPVSAKLAGLIGPIVRPTLYLKAIAIKIQGTDEDLYWYWKLGFELFVGVVVGIHEIWEETWEWRIYDHEIIKHGNVDDEEAFERDELAPETEILITPFVNGYTGPTTLYYLKAIDRGEVPSGLNYTLFNILNSPFGDVNLQLKQPDMHYWYNISGDPGLYSYNVEAFSVDMFDNVEEVQEMEIGVDLQPPDSYMTLGSPHVGEVGDECHIAAGKTNINIAAYADETKWKIMYRYWVDGVWTEWKYGKYNSMVSFTYPKTDSGMGEVEWYAVDGVGNIEGQGHSQTFYVANSIHNLDKDTYYATIHSASQDANPGDTILVKSGKYFPPATIFIDTPLTLIGENKVTTIIDSRGLVDAEAILRLINVNGATVQGFTLQSSGSLNAGCFLKYTTSCELQNCIIKNNGIGIHIGTGSSENTIYNCTISDNQNAGVTFTWEDSPSSFSPEENAVVDNIIVNNGLDGVSIENGEYNEIGRNFIYDNTRYGIHCFSDSSNNVLLNNNIEGNSNHGIYIEDQAHGTTVQDNTISYNKDGIHITDADNCVLVRNKIVRNDQDGISVEYADNTYVYHNSFIENQRYNALNTSSSTKWCHDLYFNGGNYWSDHDEEGENAFDEFHGAQQNEVGRDGIVDQGFPEGGLNPRLITGGGQDTYPLILPYAPIQNVDSAEIFNESIQDAIDAENTLDGHTIIVRPGVFHEKLYINKSLSIISFDRRYSIIDGSDSGGGSLVTIVYDNVVFSGFTLRNSGESAGDHGIAITSNNNIISNNIIKGCTEEHQKALYLYGSHYNEIYENLLMNNYFGIYLDDARYNEIYGNNVTGSLFKAILLDGASRNNFIVINKVLSNEQGVTVKSAADGNSFYHNTFDNTANALDKSINTWDNGYPFGGSYWSDYTGEDINQDGIGDTPYEIDPDYNQQTDHYPLMEPYPEYPIRNIDTSIGYFTIQSAIDDPRTLDGHTIRVERGLYKENLLIDKAITLEGADKDYVYLDGMNKGNTVTIVADNVCIHGFTIRKSGTHWDSDSDQFIDADAGIHIVSNYNEISGNCLKRNGVGISVTGGSRENLILDNEFINNTNYGVLLDNTTENEILANSFTSGGWDNGIILWKECIENLVAGNYFENLYYGITLLFENYYNDLYTNYFINISTSISLYVENLHNTIWDNQIYNGNSYGVYIIQGPQQYHSQYNIITENVIIDQSQAVYLGGSDNILTQNYISGSRNTAVTVSGFANTLSLNTITSNDGAGISTSGFYNLFELGPIEPSHYLLHNTIDNNSIGIILGFQSTVENNDITHNDRGILIESSLNTIYNNELSNNHYYGLCINGFHSDNIIYENIINDNDQTGILLQDSTHDNEIIDNTLYGNRDVGIRLQGSCRYNTIRANEIENNTNHGISIENTARYNMISQNTMTSNCNGVTTETGTYDNKIFNNNFIENIVFNAEANGNNQWDSGYPTGGNYWSDYIGVDEYYGEQQDIPGRDGLGDTPYEIPGVSLLSDYYPITYQFDPDKPVVNLDTNEYFSKIQHGIADKDTVDGNNILIRAGTYYENLILHKELNLIGQNKYTTIIDGSWNEDTILVSANYTELREFTIRNSGPHDHDAGIDVWTHDNTIHHCIIVDHDQAGIYLRNSSNNFILDNTIGRIASDTNHYGVYLENAIYNDISGNIFAHNKNGITVDMNSYENTFFMNDFLYNFYTAYSEGFNMWEGNYWDDFENNPGYPYLQYWIEPEPYLEIDSFPALEPNVYFNVSYPVEPDTVTKNRYISITPEDTFGIPTAYLVTIVENPLFPDTEGLMKWVEEIDQFETAQLQCEPYYHLPVPGRMIHIGDEDIVPGAKYHIQTTDGVSLSNPIQLNTTDGWCDLDDDNHVGFNELLTILQYWGSFVSEGEKIRYDLSRNIPDRRVDLHELLDILDAWGETGDWYAYDGPTYCPPVFANKEILRPIDNITAEWHPHGYDDNWRNVDDIIADGGSTYNSAFFYDVSDEYILSDPHHSTEDIYQVVVHAMVRSMYPADFEQLQFFVGNASTPGVHYYSETLPYKVGSGAWEDLQWVLYENPFTLENWTWMDIQDLTAGITNTIFGDVDCTQFYVEVFYNDLQSLGRGGKGRDLDENTTIYATLSSTTAVPSDMVTLELYVTNVSSLRGYEMNLGISRTSGTGSVSVPPGGVTINEYRPDFVFFPHYDVFTSINVSQMSFGAALQLGDVNVGSTPAYLGEFLIEVAPDCQGISTYEFIFSTENNSKLANNENQEVSFELNDTCILTVYGHNTPPHLPNDPQPQNQSEEVTTTPLLTWTGGDDDEGDTVTYNVYFGNSADPPLQYEGLIATEYQPEQLEEDTTYYWKIEASDGQDTVTGPLWHFTTTAQPNHAPYEPSNPVPFSTATDVPTDITLVWLGGDPDEDDSVTYDIYFDTTTPPDLVEEGLLENIYEPGLLDEGVMYYWQIIAHDTHEASTPGPVWSFTTFEEPNEPPEIPDSPTGPQTAYVGTEYDYSTTTTDPEADDVFYMWDWGDGNFTDWLGPYQSGEQCVANYTWQGNGTFNIRVKAKDIFETESTWSENLSVFVLEGFYLNLDDFPMYEAEDPPHEKCGPAVAQMTLNYMWWNQTQDDEPPMVFDDQQWLYDTGHANNTNTSLPYLDTVGLWKLLQTYRPLPYNDYGYNFNKYYRTDSDEALALICAWINYTVGTYGGYTPGHPLHVPVLVPAYGDYSNWMAIRGMHTDRPAFPLQDELTVYGFWVNDPLPDGFGANSYKMTTTWLDEYYLPLSSDDAYDGTYVTICEPPETNSDIIVNVQQAQQEFTTDQQKLMEKARQHDPELKQQHYTQVENWIIQAAINGVTTYLLPYDEQFTQVFETTEPGQPYYIVDEQGRNYYAVPFIRPIKNPQDALMTRQISLTDAQTYCVILIDAIDGSFKEASWTQQPVEYLPLAESDVLTMIPKIQEELGKPEIETKKIDLELIHRRGSPYYPEWKVTMGDIIIYVNQEGQFFL